jgi:hypothetical protein
VACRCADGRTPCAGRLWATNARLRNHMGVHMLHMLVRECQTSERGDRVSTSQPIQAGVLPQPGLCQFGNSTLHALPRPARNTLNICGYTELCAGSQTDRAQAAPSPPPDLCNKPLGQPCRRFVAGGCKRCIGHRFDRAQAQPCSTVLFICLRLLRCLWRAAATC